MNKAITRRVSQLLNEERIAHYTLSNEALNDHTIVYVAKETDPKHETGTYVVITDETLLTDLPFGG